MTKRYNHSSIRTAANRHCAMAAFQKNRLLPETDEVRAAILNLGEFL